MNTESAPTARYTVYVDDNFHYMDEEERTTHREEVTLEEAIAACVALTADSVRNFGGTDGENTYEMFGEDPWISPKPDPGELAEMLVKHPEWPAKAFERGYFSARDCAAILIAVSKTPDE